MPERNNQCSSDILSALNISVSKRTLGTDVFQSSNDCSQNLSHIQFIHLTSDTVQSVVSRTSQNNRPHDSTSCRYCDCIQISLMNTLGTLDYMVNGLLLVTFTVQLISKVTYVCVCNTCTYDK